MTVHQPTQHQNAVPDIYTRVDGQLTPTNGGSSKVSFVHYDVGFGQTWSMGYPWICKPPLVMIAPCSRVSGVCETTLRVYTRSRKHLWLPEIKNGRARWSTNPGDSPEKFRDQNQSGSQIVLRCRFSSERGRPVEPSTSIDRSWAPAISGMRCAT